MATKKKMLQAAAGNAGGGAGPDVEDVFSTYLYTGSDSATTVTNNVDLSTEGGLVWVKSRANESHYLVDTERGVGNALRTNSDSGTVQDDGYITSFNTDGFTIGANEFGMNENGVNYASWTFRKAPKFFDVVTYTGDGASDRNIPHNLGCDVGFYVVKRTDSIGDWIAYPTKNASIGTYYYMKLNTSDAEAGQIGGRSSTTFRVASSQGSNTNGATYVAYLFAHNDGDGEFGADGDADIIKCGSFEVTTGSTTVDVGFEPQFILHKRVNATGSWVMWDTMRGYSAPDGDANGAGGDAKYLYADLTNSEPTTNHGGLTSNGFVYPSNFAPGTDPGDTYIYMAIRRGTKVPESATEVFDAFTTTNAQPAGVYGSMGPVDLNVNKKSDILYGWRVFDRLRGDYQLNFDSTNVDNARDWIDFDEMDGININSTGSSYLLSDAQVHYNWKRAPNFFDVVAYTGVGGGTGISYDHNLGVVPEMMWVKNRSGSTDWIVYHKGLDATSPQDKFLNLNDTGSVGDALFWWDTAPTDTQFTVGPYTETSASGNNYIAYLFASLDGVSKVGSYTGNGSSQTIDCGFTSGARFVLIKRPNDLDNWYLFDTERGIVAGNDPWLQLNSTAQEDEFGGADILDPHPSGFTINYEGSVLGLNSSGVEHIFYAIA